MKDNQICKNILIAASFRGWGNAVVGSFIPVYFQKVFPNYSTEYSILCGSSLMIFGFLSVMIGGWLSQKYEK